MPNLWFFSLINQLNILVVIVRGPLVLSFVVVQLQDLVKISQNYIKVSMKIEKFYKNVQFHFHMKNNMLQTLGRDFLTILLPFHLINK